MLATTVAKLEPAAAEVLVDATVGVLTSVAPAENAMLATILDLVAALSHS